MDELSVHIIDLFFPEKEVSRRIPFCDISMNKMSSRKSTVKRNRVINIDPVKCPSVNKSQKCWQSKILKVVVENINLRNCEQHHSNDKNEVETGNIKELQIILTPFSAKVQKERNDYHVDLGGIETNSNSQEKERGETILNNKEMVKSTFLSNNFDGVCSPVNQYRKLNIEEKDYRVCNGISKLISNSPSIEFKQNIQVNGCIGSPITNRLRLGTRKDYFESSYFSVCNESHVKTQLSSKRIPIYKQCELNKSVEKGDPYELDVSDSEPKKKLKKRDPHNKNKRKKVVKDPKNYEDCIKSVLKNVMMKVNNVMNPHTNFTKNLDTGQEDFIKSFTNGLNPIETQDKNLNVLQSNIENSLENSYCQKEIPSVCVLPESIHNKEHLTNLSSDTEDSCEYYLFGFDDDENQVSNNRNNILGNILNSQSSTLVRDSNTQIPDIHKTVHVTNLTSDKEGNCESSMLPGNTFSKTCLFGFEEDDNQIVSKSNRINILGNIILTDPITQIQEDPWRLNTNNHSSYLIQYKGNAMPCLEQDAVVSYSLVENVEKSFSKNKSKLEKSQKSPVQTSILDFIQLPHNPKLISNKENTENSCFPTLYDYEEFETIQPNVCENRRILGEIDNFNNKIVNSTPKANKIDKIAPLDISKIFDAQDTENTPEPSILLKNTIPNINKSYFGFETVGSVTEELQNLPKEAKPFRISFNTVKNYRKNNKIDVDIVYPAQDLSLSQDIPPANSNELIQIFDDYEPELMVSVEEPIQYGRKAKRRVRLASMTSNCSDDEKTKKKKKNAMTKAEEEAFEKWAAEFNAMCSEIEKHHLEIE